MTTRSQGEYITASFEYISQCAKEVESLADCIKDRVRKRMERDARSLGFAVAGGWEQERRYEAHEWLQSDAAWSLPLKKAGKGKQVAKSYLSIQVSLSGDGLIPGSKEPVVHVCCFDEASNFSEDDYYYMGFPVEDDEDSEELCRIHHQRCLVWYRNTETPWMSSWCYSLRLTALLGVADVDRLVVEPSMKLLSGASVLDALPDNLLDREVFSYRDADLSALGIKDFDSA